MDREEGRWLCLRQSADELWRSADLTDYAGSVEKSEQPGNVQAFPTSPKIEVMLFKCTYDLRTGDNHLTDTPKRKRWGAQV